MYYCAKCKHQHRNGSAIGLGHDTYKTSPDECPHCENFRKNTTLLFCADCGTLFREKRDGYDWR